MTRLRAIIVGLTACLATAAVSAQPPGPPPPPAPLDAAGRTAVVKAAADALRQRYVYPDVGNRAADAIEAALAAGKYDEIVQPWAFAERHGTWTGPGPRRRDGHSSARSSAAQRGRGYALRPIARQHRLHRGRRTAGARRFQGAGR